VIDTSTESALPLPLKGEKERGVVLANARAVVSVLA